MNPFKLAVQLTGLFILLVIFLSVANAKPQADLDMSNLDSLTLADKQYGCQNIVKPAERRIGPALYERVLACHQIWRIAKDYHKTNALGKQADFQHKEFFMGEDESKYIDVEAGLAKTFSKYFMPDSGRISLSEAKLNHAIFGQRKSAPLIDFTSAEMEGASFYSANLSGINFANSNCKGCRFVNVDLARARFYLADLTDSYIKDSKLGEATFDAARVDRMKFNPDVSSMPSAVSFISARGLRNLSYDTQRGDSAAILKLREEIRKTENRDALREINYAIRSNRRSYQTEFDYLFNELLFGRTVGYGLYLSRPIEILGFMVPIFALLYLLSMTVRSKSGVFIIWDKDRVDQEKGSQTPEQLTLDQPFPGTYVAIPAWAPEPIKSFPPNIGRLSALTLRLKILFRWLTWRGAEERARQNIGYLAWLSLLSAFLILGLLAQHNAGQLMAAPTEYAREEGRNLRIWSTGLFMLAVVASLWAGLSSQIRHAWRMAVWLSVLSILRFGWRDLSLGTWLTVVQREEYTIRPSGWVRTAAGIQSIIGLLMVGLWAVCYFKGPLE